MTTPPQDPNAQLNAQPQYGQQPQPQYGQPQMHPEMAKDLKNAKLYGILSVVLSSIALIIFGFLSLPGLVAGIMGLRLSNKLQAAGVLQGNSKVLNIVGIIIGGIAVVLWILGIILIVASA